MPHHPGHEPARLQVTTLWDHPTRDYGGETHGNRYYAGSTPAWLIWNLLTRYTKAGDTVVDPMCGSGTTLDVAADLGRTGRGFDLKPTRPDIAPADARSIPLGNETADFLFMDPPYSTHIDYSDDPRCIGKLNAATPDYWQSMQLVCRDAARVLKNGAHMAVYVSDSWEKSAGFLPIGFEMFAILREIFTPVDIITVKRYGKKVEQGNYRKAAEEGNFFLRGFNYLFIMRKELRAVRDQRLEQARKNPRKPPKQLRPMPPLPAED
mgnify:CR=1 FL=1